MADDGRILVGELTLGMGDLAARVQEANRILQGIGDNAAQNMQAVSAVYQQMARSIVNTAQQAQQAANAINNTTNTSRNNQHLRDAEIAYRRLIQANREYDVALKNGNVQQQVYWRSQIQAGQQ